MALTEEKLRDYLLRSQSAFAPGSWRLTDGRATRGITHDLDECFGGGRRKDDYRAQHAHNIARDQAVQLLAMCSMDRQSGRDPSPRTVMQRVLRSETLSIWKFVPPRRAEALARELLRSVSPIMRLTPVGWVSRVKHEWNERRLSTTLGTLVDAEMKKVFEEGGVVEPGTKVRLVDDDGVEETDPEREEEPTPEGVRLLYRDLCRTLRVRPLTADLKVWAALEKRRHEDHAECATCWRTTATRLTPVHCTAVDLVGYCKRERRLVLIELKTHKQQTPDATTLRKYRLQAWMNVVLFCLTNPEIPPRCVRAQLVVVMGAGGCVSYYDVPAPALDADVLSRFPFLRYLCASRLRALYADHERRVLPGPYATSFLESGMHFTSPYHTPPQQPPRSSPSSRAPARSSVFAHARRPSLLEPYPTAKPPSPPAKRQRVARSRAVKDAQPAAVRQPAVRRTTRASAAAAQTRAEAAKTTATTTLAAAAATEVVGTEVAREGLVAWVLEDTRPL